MPRTPGSVAKGKNEFARLYEQMCQEENINPVRVLFKLMKSRTQAIRLQAASQAMKYRFPVQAALHHEVQAASQMVMTWDESGEKDPPQLEELQDPAIIGTATIIEDKNGKSDADL